MAATTSQLNILGPAVSSAPAPRSLLPPNHPISLKLRSILTKTPSKHDEQRTHEALAILQDIYPCPPAKTKGKGKYRAAFDDDDGDAGAFEAFDADDDDDADDDAPLPHIQVDVARAKRCLETDAQMDLLDAGDEVVKLLQDVDLAVEEVQAHLQDMHSVCDDIDQKLAETSDATRWLLEQAQGLQRQMKTTSQQKVIVDVFLAHFTLTQAEQEAITSRDVPVGKRLFASMDRLDRIRSDCRSLLEGGGQAGGGTRAGMNIMSATSHQLDAAYDKIARYLGFQFRQAPREGLDVSNTLREAVRRIIDGREDLLRPALQTLVSMRSSFLANSFHTALTQGNASSGSRPIELHAHDPLRYAGDMLAWIHQTVAGEREFLGQLLGEGEGEGGRKVGERRRGIEGSIDWTGAPGGAVTSSDNKSAVDGKRAIYLRELLDKCLEGCCRPLRIRIDQTVRSQEGSITLFRLANLIQFYKVTMQRTIGSKVSLSRCLQELSDSAFNAFFAVLERQGNGLLRTIHPPESDLSPPAALLGATATLKELLSAQQVSLWESSPAPASSQPQPSSEDLSPLVSDFDAVTSHLLTPVLALLHRTAELLPATATATASSSSSPQRDAAILRANAAEHLLSTLAPYSAFVPRSARAMRDLLDENVEQLVHAEGEDLLGESRLGEALGAITTAGPSGAPAAATATSTSPATALAPLRHFASTFLSSSPSLLTGPPFLARLFSPTLRAAVHKRGLHRLVAVYEEVLRLVEGGAHAEAHTAAQGAAQGEGEGAAQGTTWEALRGELRSVDEVRMLLGVDSEIEGARG